MLSAAGSRTSRPCGKPPADRAGRAATKKATPRGQLVVNALMHDQSEFSFTHPLETDSREPRKQRGNSYEKTFPRKKHFQMVIAPKNPDSVLLFTKVKDNSGIKPYLYSDLLV